MRNPTRLPPVALAALSWLAALAGCDPDPPDWGGRYEGTFEATYTAHTRLTAHRGNLVTSRFAGTAWVEVTPDDEHLALHVADCDTAWRPEGARATLVEGQRPEGCRLDVAGDTGVVHIRPTSGTARLAEDSLALTLEAEGDPADGSDAPSSLTFAFEGHR